MTTQMTVDFSKDVMLGMLRKGQTGTQILDILNVIVPDETELTREQVCEDLGIADCPENDDEIALAMSAAWFHLGEIWFSPSPFVSLSLISMFVSCPVSFDLIDAEWYQDVDNAKEDALDWSAELSGENVIVYRAVEGEDGDYEFKKLYSICAWF